MAMVTTRRLFRHARRAEAVNARRIVGVSKDSPRAPCFSVVAANAGATYPKGEGDEHICTAPGAARKHGSNVRLLSRTEGLKAIAERIHQHTRVLAKALSDWGSAGTSNARSSDGQRQAEGEIGCFLIHFVHRSATRVPSAS